MMMMMMMTTTTTTTTTMVVVVVVVVVNHPKCYKSEVFGWDDIHVLNTDYWVMPKNIDTHEKKLCLFFTLSSRNILFL